MKKLLGIAIIVSFVLGFACGPPDLITQWSLGTMAAILCLIILGGLFCIRSVKQASSLIHRILTILVICLAAGAVKLAAALMTIRHLRGVINR